MLVHNRLGLLVKAHHDSNKKLRISVEDVVDECKTFYFSRQETTNSFLAWTIFLLSIHIDWQKEAKKENPNLDGIPKLKTVRKVTISFVSLWPYLELLKLQGTTLLHSCLFRAGPRCFVGFNFAITQVKLALSMILQRYTFALSPAYVSPFRL
ncbi:Cytochrome P [Parasponia andersonii]|uniref:Cytochrome P n=1 Tax=Parasponia andersonii TaxID=3476 RepID=A0A2P5E2I4_PARAD|nr:Cytochrome P [Parasponia andersonii]